MSSLKINAIANFVGQIWGSLLVFLLVPVYIKYLGIESYGLLGFFLSLQALVSIMDLGLSTTANREVARNASDSKATNRLFEVLCSLEYIYVGFGVAISLLFYFSADVIATNWISATSLTDDVVRNSVLLFGITLGLRWPISLYSGILRGLEKQVSLNVITISFASLRALGSFVLVVFVKQSILYLLSWQLFCGFLEVFTIYIYTWRAVPRSASNRRVFSLSSVKSVLGFSSTVALISLFAVMIKQFDKVIISKLLPLEEMGYYATAFQAFTAIQLFIIPVSTAVFPRLSSIIRSKDEKALAEVYHKTSKIIAFAASPIAALFIFNSYDILLFWTKSEIVAGKSSIALSILAFAAMFNSVMQASYVLQLASGLQRIALFNNIIAFLFFTPITYFLVLKFGINGGALSWAIYNVVYYSVIPSITHKHILKNHLRRWITRDTLPFFVLAIVLFGLSFVASHDSATILKYPLTCFSLIIYILISFFYDSKIKEQIIELLGIFKKFKTKFIK